MPTVMNHRHIVHREQVEKTTPQKVSMSLGVALIVAGAAGAIMPGFLGLHHSFAHNLFFLISGVAALAFGYAKATWAYNFCLFYGAFMGVLGIAGFLIGTPGYTSHGLGESDQSLFRVLPNVLEFGSLDHLVHLLIAGFLIFTAYTLRKDKPSVRKF